MLGFGRTGSYATEEANDEYLPFVVTVLEEDRDGDVVNPAGLELKNYERNPCWFFGHQEWLIPIGTSRAPDGRICVFPDINVAKAWFFPDKGDEDAMFIAGKVRRGILNATSIAFVPIEAWKRDEQRKAHQNQHSPTGWMFNRVDLTEISIVGVPANPWATREQKEMRGALRDAVDREAKSIRPRLRKALEQYCAKSTNESGGCWTGWCPCPSKVEKEMPKQAAKHSCSCKAACACKSKGIAKGYVEDAKTAYDGAATMPQQQFDSLISNLKRGNRADIDAAWAALGARGPATASQVIQRIINRRGAAMRTNMIDLGNKQAAKGTKPMAKFITVNGVRYKAMGEASGAAGGYMAEKANNLPVKVGDKVTSAFGSQGKVTKVDADTVTIRYQDGTVIRASAAHNLTAMGDRSWQVKSLSHRCTFCKGTGNGTGRPGDCPDCGGRGVVRVKSRVKHMRHKALSGELGSKWLAMSRGQKVQMTDAELDALEAYLMTVPDGSEDDKNASYIASTPSGNGYTVWLKKSMKRTKAMDDGAEIPADDTAPPDAAPHDVAMAQLYQTAKDEHEYLGKALEGITPFDPQSGEANPAHKALTDYHEQVGKRVEDIKGMFGEHASGEQKDVEEFAKGMDTDGIDTSNTGEANLIDAGDVPEDVELDDSQMDDAAATDTVQMDEENSAVEMDMDEQETMALDDEQQMGLDADEMTAEKSEDDADHDTEEILERYQKANNMPVKVGDKVVSPFGEQGKIVKVDVDTVTIRYNGGTVIQASAAHGLTPMGDRTWQTKSLYRTRIASADHDTEEILERYQKQVVSKGNEIQVSPRSARAMKSECQQAGVTATYVKDRGTGMLQTEVYRLEGDQEDIDEIARKYQVKQWANRPASTARVAKVLSAGGSVRKGGDGRRWLVAKGQFKVGDKVQISETGNYTDNMQGTVKEILPNGNIGVQLLNSNKVTWCQPNELTKKSFHRRKGLEAVEPGVQGKALEPDHAEAVKSCGNMMKGMAQMPDMPEHHKMALDVVGDELHKAAAGEHDDPASAIGKAVKHLKALGDAPDVPEHHQQALSFHGKALKKAMKAMGVDEPEEKTEDDEKQKDESEETAKALNSGQCPLCKEDLNAMERAQLKRTGTCPLCNEQLNAMERTKSEEDEAAEKELETEMKALREERTALSRAFRLNGVRH